MASSPDSNATSDGIRGATFFDDPLKNWPNDDLLMNDQNRAYVLGRHPELAPILDWPELRSMFAQLDPIAATARKRSRQAGIAVAAIGFLGLALTALTPFLAALVPQTYEHSIQFYGGLTAIAAVVVATTLGYGLLLMGRSKADWLCNRFYVERLRQFYFQFILANFERALAVTNGSESGESFMKLRAASLKKFEMELVCPVAERLAHLKADHLDDLVWLEQRPRPAVFQHSDTRSVEELLEVLSKQRLGVQRRYATMKMKPGFYSPASRDKIFEFLSDLFTIFAMFAALGTGGLLVAGFAENATIFKGTVAAGGVFTGLIVAIRVLASGLQVKEEAERYEWYDETMASLAERFEKGTRTEKFDVLCEVEEAAYREMRRFLVSFDRARFVM